MAQEHDPKEPGKINVTLWFGVNRKTGEPLHVVAPENMRGRLRPWCAGAYVLQNEAFETPIAVRQLVRLTANIALFKAIARARNPKWRP